MASRPGEEEAEEEEAQEGQEEEGPLHRRQAQEGPAQESPGLLAGRMGGHVGSALTLCNANASAKPLSVVGTCCKVCLSLSGHRF